MKFTKRQLQILATGKKMFVERGFTETSMRDLAAELNIQAASLYNHFASKEDILETYCIDISKRFRIIRLELEGAELTPHQKFEEFIKRYLTEILHDTYTFELYLSYWNYNETFQAKFEAGRSDFIKFVQRLFKDMDIKNSLEHFKPEAQALMILNALNQTPQLLTNKENPDVESIVQYLSTRILHGVKSDL